MAYTENLAVLSCTQPWLSRAVGWCVRSLRLHCEPLSHQDARRSGGAFDALGLAMLHTLVGRSRSTQYSHTLIVLRVPPTLGGNLLWRG